MPDKPLRLLILHMRFYPDATGTSPIVTDLAVDLASLGASVTVVTSIPHYGKTRIDDEYRGTLFHQSQYQGVDVRRVLVYVPPNPSFFHRAINYLSFTVMSVLAGLASGRHDVLLAISPPSTIALSGWIVAAMRSARMVFNVQDIWPESILGVNQTKNRWVVRILQWLEVLSYELSNQITVLSEGMHNNLVAKGVPPKNIEVIPNWADTKSITPVSKNNDFRRKYNPEDKVLVMFAGNIGYISVLDTVLEAAHLLNGDERYYFVIVGEGNDKGRLMGKAEDLQLENLRFVTTQPRERLSEMLGAADISLVTLKKKLGWTNVPSKVYSIMASARPVLAAVPGNSEIARVVELANCGILVPPENPTELASAIQQMANERQALNDYGQNGRLYVEEHNNREKLTRQYYQLLQTVSAAEPPK